jgi:Tol biopolymer transport system component
MATQKVREDPDTQERPIAKQRRSVRNLRIAAFATVIVLIAVAAVAFGLGRSENRGQSLQGVTPSIAPSILGSAGSMVDLTTHQVTPLPDNIQDAGSYFVVSPDHTKIAFGTCCSSNDPLYVANIDGTGIRRVTPAGADGYGAQWSPDGSMILYQQRDDTTSKLGNLFLVDVATRRQTQLTNFDQSKGWGWWFTFPSFRPDGRYVLYQLPRGGVGLNNAAWDLWMVPVDGRTPSLAARDAGWGALAYGKATARRDFAYLAPMNVSDLSGGGLWLTSWDLRSVEPREMVQGGGHLSWLRWSPDGTRISYSDGGSVYVLNIGTGETTKVAEGDKAEWFDDHTLVIGYG